MRYTVTFARTVRPADYESIRIELTQEFDTDDMLWETAYDRLRQFVLGKIEEELARTINRPER